MLCCYMGNESKAHFWIIMDGFPSPLDVPPLPSTRRSTGTPETKKWGFNTRCNKPLRRAPLVRNNKKKHGWKASNLWSPMVRSSSTNCLPARIRTWWSGGVKFTEWGLWSEKKSMLRSWRHSFHAAWDVFIRGIHMKTIYPHTPFSGQKPDVCPDLAQWTWRFDYIFFYLTCLNMDVTSCHNWNFQLEIVKIGEKGKYPLWNALREFRTWKLNGCFSEEISPQKMGAKIGPITRWGFNLWFETNLRKLPQIQPTLPYLYSKGVAYLQRSHAVLEWCPLASP